MTTAPPVLIQLEIDDPASAWEAAGFAVGDDGSCLVGAVTLRFGDSTRGGGIRAWSLTGVDARVTTIDGLRLTAPGNPAPPVTHPNTASRIDHLVIQTPDVERTVLALEAVGLAERRRRHTESYGSPMTQVFHRAGEVIIEVVGPPQASGDEPASFFGLAFTLDDLDAPAALLGDAVRDRRPAVQEGRDRRGLRHERLGLSVPVLLMSAPRLMLDHVFTDAIGALREALHGALLERQAFEERFQADVLLGDLTWETSYALPGEGTPPRVQADITMDWPTWAQTAYRSWYIGETIEDPPRIDIELVLRVQRLADRPDPSTVLDRLPTESPTIGGDRLVRSGPTIGQLFTSDLSEEEFAIEVSYEGSYELGEDVLEDGNRLDRDFGAMGGWISATLVRLGDLTFDFKPPFDVGGPRP